MDKPERTDTFTPTIHDNASVKIIGLGGVGGIVARYGAMFLGSLGKRVRLVLIDGDTFEPSNATRMYFSRAGNKAAVVRDDLIARFSESLLTLVAVEQYITPENVGTLLREGDIVLVAVDNHATRKLIDEHCAKLGEVCVISAGNDGVGPDGNGRQLRGTFGNCQVHLRRGGQDIAPPLWKFHPEIASPADKLPTDKSCTELVASTPQILLANLTAAASCLNALWLYLCGRLHYAEACFDIALAQMAPVPLPTKLPLHR